MSESSEVNAFSPFVVIGRETASILESITDAFIVLDRDWRFTYINLAAKEPVPAFGGEPEHLLGKVLWEKFPRLKDTKLGEQLLRAVREGKATEYEEFYPDLGAWFHGRIYPSEGSVSGYFENITERKWAEEALRSSEDRLRQAIEIETVGVIFLDTDGRLADANDAFLRMSGFDRQDLEQGLLSWQEMTPPEWMERSWQAVEELHATGRTTPYEKEYIRKDGSRWRALFAAKLLDDGEAVEFVIDVTERRRTQEALRENEEWLRLAQQAARSGTWEWDLKSGEIRWSEEHRELFGFDAESPVTRERWWKYVHPEDLPLIEEAGRRCSERGEQWPEIEYRVLRNGETRWINARGRTVREGDLPVRILGISVDVTERNQAEAERDRLLAREWVARTEVAERERISRELHDRVAHSMGVAHQSLQLYEVLKENQPSQAAAKLALAKEMTKAALESTRNLSMELRRSEAEEGLVLALEDLLKVAVPAHIWAGLDVRGDESYIPPHVRGQLFAILREAVRNAARHSGASNLRVELDVSPEAAACSVEDDGKGLPAQETGKTRDNGTVGGGLRSMRERATLLGGDFRISSSPGNGTRVEVSVPLSGGA